MSRKSRTTLSAVERLIEQRRLFHDWLSKLGEGVDAMPGHVVERVRNDYRSRLDGVMAELGEHREALREALEEAQQRQEGLGTVQQQRKDELAELRLRRHVGEMDDPQFKEQSGALQAALDQIKKDIGAALRDIERYEEILEVITSGDAPAQAAAPAAQETPLAQDAPVAAQPPPVETEAAAEAPLVEAPVAEAKAVAGQSAAAKPAEEAKAPTEPERAAASARKSYVASPAKQTASAPAAAGAKPDLDELEFLRSVTSAASPVKAPPPRSPKPPGASPAKPEPARIEGAAALSLDAAPGLMEMGMDAQPEAQKAPPAAAAPVAEQSSLTCKECGAVNRPTEWYCEKCGAELAAF